MDILELTLIHVLYSKIVSSAMEIT